MGVRIYIWRHTYKSSNMLVSGNDVKTTRMGSAWRKKKVNRRTTSKAPATSLAWRKGQSGPEQEDEVQPLGFLNTK